MGVSGIVFSYKKLFQVFLAGRCQNRFFKRDNNRGVFITPLPFLLGRG